MKWLSDLFFGHSMAHAVFVLSLVAFTGLALGSLKVRGIGLGIAGVLFSGLVFGHFGITIDHHVIEFAREFGLILFVYTIGMQVGPGFFGSLQRQGLPLNLMAAGIVIFGALITLSIHKLGGVPMEAAVGLFSGGTTNTPSLGAAQEALRSLPHATPAMLQTPGLGYAVAYPFGIMGIILTMLVLRALFRVNIKAESDALKYEQLGSTPKLSTLNLEVKNPNLEGRRVSEIPAIDSLGVSISRLQHNDQVQIATPESSLSVGDRLLAVGTAEKLEQLRVIVGEASSLDLRQIESPIVVRRVVVTKDAVLGKRVEELELERFNVAVTRVARAEVELPVTPDRRLQFGDMIFVVGLEGDIEKAGKLLGNKVSELNHARIIPIFVGIALGIVAGSIPLALPGVPAPVKLGLAGGPLICAILLSRLGKIGPLLWYMPINANFIVREIGIVLFLSCVGLHSGEKFIHTLVHGEGLRWMALAALITFLPIMAVGLIARIFAKQNYVTLCGLLAGSMTDPPALAFANAVAKSAGPSVAYATVYPLTMLLRVLCAQLLVLFFV